MAKVSITADTKAQTVNAGSVAVAQITKAAGNPCLGAKIKIAATNQQFSCQDNVTIQGGEIITTSLL